MPQAASNKILPIAKEGYPFILPLLGLSAVLFWLGFACSGSFCLATGLFCVFFFRDPERDIPADPRAVVSPADGRVIDITQTEVPGFSEPLTKVSIFLSVFNVHVNRSPIAGKVEAFNYIPGKFVAAWADKASSDNERTEIIFAGKQGRVMVKQIAGLIARRIVWWINTGDMMEKGQRIGLIRFGSRVEIFLPQTVTELKVSKGDVVKGGKSIIALI